jgi:hypothetical protein
MARIAQLFILISAALAIIYYLLMIDGICGQEPITVCIRAAAQRQLPLQFAPIPKASRDQSVN